MSEQTITGVCVEIAQKPGSDWCEFHVDGGGKYPVRLSTKLQPLIELGRAAGGNLATWTYNEVESEKINEKSGKPYVNRYLERVEVGGSVAEPDHPDPQDWIDATAASRLKSGIKVDASGSPSSARVYTPDLKDRMIVRQTALKAAAQRLEGLASEDPGLDTMKLAQRFETWVYRDIDPPPFAPDLSEHDAAIPF